MCCCCSHMFPSLLLLFFLHLLLKRFKCTESSCCSLSYPTTTRTLSPYTLIPQTRQCRPSHFGMTLLSETHTMPVQRLKLAGLTVLQARSLFRANSNHWQISPEGSGWMIPKDDTEISSCIDTTNMRFL